MAGGLMGGLFAAARQMSPFAERSDRRVAHWPGDMAADWPDQERDRHLNYQALCAHG